MYFKWATTKRTDDLTVTIVSRNLVTLGYPFIESFVSAIPLGCRFIIGDCSTDETPAIFEELAKYAPLEIHKINWALDKEPGYGAVAIGLATQETIQHSQTEYVFNIQASEILCNDVAIDVMADHPWVKPGLVGPRMFNFRHFYGSMHHGGPGYGGFPKAPRIYKRDTKFDKTNACFPNDYCGGFPCGKGWINRYGYCWLNTITAKLTNQKELYWQDPATRIAEIMDLRDVRNWAGNHPLCVRHLIDLDNYDVNYSLEFAKKHLLV